MGRGLECWKNLLKCCPTLLSDIQCTVSILAGLVANDVIGNFEEEQTIFSQTKLNILFRYNTCSDYLVSQYCGRFFRLCFLCVYQIHYGCGTMLLCTQPNVSSSCSFFCPCQRRGFSFPAIQNVGKPKGLLPIKSLCLPTFIKHYRR